MNSVTAPLRTRPRKSVILGLPLLAITPDQVPDYLAELVRRRTASQLTLGTLPLAIASAKDVLVQAVLAEAEAVLVGSQALSWAAKRLGCPLPYVFSGPAVVSLAAQTAAKFGWQLGLLGAEPDDLTQAAARLQTAHPGLLAPLTFTGPSNDEEALRKAIRAAKLDILLVGLPPATETEWIYRQLPWLRTPVVVGVGDGLAVTSGRLEEVPEKFAQPGLSWLYHLINNPWTRVPLYWMQLWFVLRELRSQQNCLREVPTRANLTLPIDPNILFLEWTGRVDADSLADLPIFMEPNQHSGLVLDLRAVSFIDSTGLGHLLQAYRTTKANGAGFVLLAPSSCVRDLLRVTHLNRFIVMAETIENAAAYCREQTPRFTPSSQLAHPGELVLTIQGDLTAPRLDAANRWLASAWENHPGSLDLTVDLGQVRLLDSSGIGWLLQARRLSRDRGGSISIRNARGQPAQILTQTRLLQALNVT